MREDEKMAISGYTLVGCVGGYIIGRCIDLQKRDQHNFPLAVETTIVCGTFGFAYAMIRHHKQHRKVSEIKEEIKDGGKVTSVYGENTSNTGTVASTFKTAVICVMTYKLIVPIVCIGGIGIIGLCCVFAK